MPLVCHYRSSTSLATQGWARNGARMPSGFGCSRACAQSALPDGWAGSRSRQTNPTAWRASSSVQRLAYLRTDLVLGNSLPRRVYAEALSTVSTRTRTQRRSRDDPERWAWPEPPGTRADPAMADAL